MLSQLPKTIKLQEPADNQPVNGSIAFVDFDGDGIQDLSVAGGNQFEVYMGSDSAGGLNYRLPAIKIKLPADLDSIVGHSYSDLDNDGRYECIVTLKNGTIHLAEFNNEELIISSALLTRQNEMLYAKMIDVNGDHRNDLLVYSEKNGLMVYKRVGTDDIVILDGPEMITDENGAVISDLRNSPVFWDLDGDGWNDPVVARATASMQQYTSNGDSVLFRSSAAEDCNAGGQRVDDVTDVALLVLSNRKPKLVLLRGGRLYAYSMQLAGDVTGDGIVNIADISKIANA